MSPCDWLCGTWECRTRAQQKGAVCFNRCMLQVTSQDRPVCRVEKWNGGINGANSDYCMSIKQRYPWGLVKYSCVIICDICCCYSVEKCTNDRIVPIQWSDLCFRPILHKTTGSCGSGSRWLSRNLWLDPQPLQSGVLGPDTELQMAWLTVCMLHNVVTSHRPSR